MLSVHSATDSNGVFTYSITRGADDALWGGGSGALTIIIPSFGVLTTYDPPGWTSSMAAPDVVAWNYASTGTWLVSTMAATLSLQSASAVPVEYDSIAPGAEYGQGTLLGDVYTTNGAFYQSGSTSEVCSVNVAGYERFAFIGPALPEPFGCAALAMAVLLTSKRARGGLRALHRRHP
ncbi:hypothetical protein GX586_08475 [bacterium]|nr:hypothetical protein [bacterium]